MNNNLCDTLSELALGMFASSDEEKEDIQNKIITVLENHSNSVSITEFTELRTKYNISLPYLSASDDGYNVLTWKHPVFTSSGQESAITSVTVTFYPVCCEVDVICEEYKYTKINEIGYKWHCTFYSVNELIIYLLQLKDLGIIR